jgi:hypothetical protein
VTTTEPEPPAAATTPPAEPPVSDRYRSNAPADPAEIRRKLLFGVALVMALVSVYAGLLQWGRLLQYGFAGLAVLTVFIALLSGLAAPPRPPVPPPPPGQPGAGA